VQIRRRAGLWPCADEDSTAIPRWGVADKDIERTREAALDLLIEGSPNLPAPPDAGRWRTVVVRRDVSFPEKAERGPIAFPPNGTFELPFCGRVADTGLRRRSLVVASHSSGRGRVPSATERMAARAESGAEPVPPAGVDGHEPWRRPASQLSAGRGAAYGALALSSRPRSISGCAWLPDVLGILNSSGSRCGPSLVGGA